MELNFAELERYIDPERIIKSSGHTAAFSATAGVYRLTPQAVIFIETFFEIQIVLEYCNRYNIPTAFRGSGSSFSSSSVTSGVLLDVSRFMNQLKMKGNQVTVSASVSIGSLNRFLKKQGLRIGRLSNLPEQSTIGGAIATGAFSAFIPIVRDNFRLKAMQYVLPLGIAVDTAEEDADVLLAAKSPTIWHGILSLKQKIIASSLLKQKLFSGKTHTGAGIALDAFLKAEKPAEIIKHLLVGSSGRLGFIGEVTLETEKIFPCQLHGIWYITEENALEQAAEYLYFLGAEEVQIQDQTTVTLVHNNENLPSYIIAIAFCFYSENTERIHYIKNSIYEKMIQLPLHGLSGFTTHPTVLPFQELYSIFLRYTKIDLPLIVLNPFFAKGNSLGMLHGIQKLIMDHFMQSAVIIDPINGSIILVGRRKTENEEEWLRLRDSISDLASSFGGGLLYLSGLGDWDELYKKKEVDFEILQIWQELTSLLDPAGILEFHKNEKKYKEKNSLPLSLAYCTECGLCSDACSSTGLTFSPVQRLRVLKEIYQSGVNVSDLDISQLAYNMVLTCSNDGLCALHCPLGIDTGLIVHNDEKLQNMLSSFKKRKNLFSNLIRILRLKKERIRKRNVRITKKENITKTHFVYISNCLSGISVSDRNDMTRDELFYSLCDKAGKSVLPIPFESVCCGKCYENNGDLKSFRRSINHLIASIYKNGSDKTYILETDQCGKTVMNAYSYLTDENKLRFKKLQFLSSLDFIQNQILPDVNISPSSNQMIFSQTECSVHLLGKSNVLSEILHKAGHATDFGTNSVCCGRGVEKDTLFLMQKTTGGKENWGKNETTITISGSCTKGFKNSVHLYQLLVDSVSQ